MVLRRLVIVIFLSFLKLSLFAQATDTLPHVDSPLITKEVKDSIAVSRAGNFYDSVKPAPKHKGYIINGKVEDANTGEGIPFANVYFPGTQVGTAADLNGNFVIKIDKLPGDTLHIGAIGYAPENKILRTVQHDYNYIIELERSNTALSDVVFHAGEDPAVVLVRHIIEHKPGNNPDKTENYNYEAYNRLEADLQRLTKSQFGKIPILKNYTFIYDNLDTVSETKPYLPLYLTETLSDYYFRKSPKKQREFIKASMVKGVNNENVVKYLGTLHQSVNIYRNFIPVFDKKFVSPISNEGLFYYKYKIKDTQRVYGYNVILVQFRPRSVSTRS